MRRFIYTNPDGTSYTVTRVSAKSCEVRVAYVYRRATATYVSAMIALPIGDMAARVVVAGGTITAREA